MSKRLMLLAAIALAPSLALAQEVGEAGKAMMQANEKMMRDMHGMKVTGDPDRDFVMMMIPHHQGAIDMARVQLRYGKDETLRAMAEKIIADQEREIAEMKAWLAKQAR